jgi:hypothetical protein
MRLRFKYNVGRWIMRRFRGKVIYPFVLFSMAKKDVPVTLFRHELEHVYQVRRMGWVRFHVKYLWLLAKYGYKKHPFELEATARQKDPLTAAEKRLRKG